MLYYILDNVKDIVLLICWKIQTCWYQFATFVGIYTSSSQTQKQQPTDLVFDVVLTIFVGIILVAIFILHIHRKIRARALHKQRYGNATFPPLAGLTKVAAGGGGGKNVMATISALRDSSPTFFTHCSKLLGPVFRLNTPPMMITGNQNDGSKGSSRKQDRSAKSTSSSMIVVVGELQLAHTILNDPRTTKPENLYTPISSIVNGIPNILTSTGTKWNHSRLGVKSAFNKSNLQRMHHVCKVKTEEWIRTRIEPSIVSSNNSNANNGGENNNSYLDIGHELVILTLSILSETLFEYRISRYEAMYIVEEFNLVIEEFAINQGQRYPFRSNIIFSLLLPSIRRAKKARKHLFDFGLKILESYRKKKKRGKVATSSQTVIGCIVNSKEYENDQHRIADIIMFLFSGIDSTAYSLAWTLYELSKPKNKTELSNLRVALNGTDDQLAHTMLKDILREGMRLHPAIPAVGIRTVWKDFYFNNNTMVIPKGTNVIFPSILLTRTSVENGDKFIPSRWRDHPNKSFLLFSSGPRNCIAQGLALAEMTWVLSRVCSEYDFDVIEEASPTTKYDITNKCVGVLLQAKRTISTTNEELRTLQHPSLSPKVSSSSSPASSSSTRRI